MGRPPDVPLHPASRRWDVPPIPPFRRSRCRESGPGRSRCCNRRDGRCEVRTGRAPVRHTARRRLRGTRVARPRRVSGEPPGGNSGSAADRVAAPCWRRRPARRTRRRRSPRSRGRSACDRDTPSWLDLLHSAWVAGRPRGGATEQGGQPRGRLRLFGGAPTKRNYRATITAESRANQCVFLFGDTSEIT